MMNTSCFEINYSINGRSFTEYRILQGTPETKGKSLEWDLESFFEKMGAEKISIKQVA